MHDLICKCHCGACCISLIGVAQGAPAFDCHCPHCRRIASAPFVSCLEVDSSSIQYNEEEMPLRRYQERCNHLGTVTRLFCGSCFSSLATIPDEKPAATENDSSLTSETSKWYINMGALDDAEIPAAYCARWRTSRKSWCQSERAPWYPSFPEYDEDNSPEEEKVVAGACSCGQARFRMVPWDTPNDLPHCYCKLCREMSGGAFMSWTFVTTDCFEWLTDEPPLIRTTSFGQRHICETCGVNLTIVYDEEVDDYIWPSAGCLDDDRFRNLDRYLENVSHIYCKDRPKWYALPDDGLPRWDDGPQSTDGERVPLDERERS